MLLTLLISFFGATAATKPNIIFILADDLGWNDVGFHGSNQIPTPNIDALAFSGVILNNYYVLPLCTPSRAALLTGRHPIHNGMQHEVIYSFEPWGLPLRERLLPQYLRTLDYATHLVGKWHLGLFKKRYTPLSRGFDSHFGFWSGHLDYYDHNAEENPRYWGHDLRRGMNATRADFGRYLTSVLTDEAVTIIARHDTARPMFMLLAHAAPHAGNPAIPLQAPPEEIAKFPHIQDMQRRKYAAMVSMLDQSVGAVISALGSRGMLENSIVVFSSDNGGAAGGYNMNEASTWPLRGGKDTTWEGGVKGAALVWSPLLSHTPRVSHQICHVQDWLPTLLAATNSSHLLPKRLDGRNIWPALDHPDKKTYSELLIQADLQRNISALRVGRWKLVRGTTWDGRYDVAMGISGRPGEYDVTGLRGSAAARAIEDTSSPLPDTQTVLRLRTEATVVCKKENASQVCHPVQGEVCLFDLISDPCESRNLAASLPLTLAAMSRLLDDHSATAVAPRNKPLDPRSNPKFWGYTWTNWGDFPPPPGADQEEGVRGDREEYKII